MLRGQATSVLPWLLLPLRLLGTQKLEFSLQVSTLVGKHCKSCQQQIIKTTKNEVQGTQANSSISVSFNTRVGPHHEAWKVPEASMRGDQTHSLHCSHSDTEQ